MVVGRQDHAVFGDLLSFLRNDPSVLIVGQHVTIRQALVASLNQTDGVNSVDVDAVVVLQSFSDEYAIDDINRLIGRMLFGRVFCCYGPWCEADGRSHGLWPISTRVPVGSALAVISHELAALSAGEDPLSPMSAAEEVFAHRVRQLHSSSSPLRPLVLIVSHEVALREIVAQNCRDLGFETAISGMSVDALNQTLESASTQPLAAILDLDPPDQPLQFVVTQLRQLIPTIVLVGITVVPWSQPESLALDIVLDMCELHSQLRWHLKLLCTASE